MFTNCQDDINTLCKSLFDSTEITYFSHTRVNKKFEFYGFSSNCKFTEHYLDNRYYNNDIHLLNLDDKVKYIHWDLLTRKGKTKTMHDDFAAFNYGHTFSIIETFNNHKDCYHFAADLNNLSINSKYYTYIETLEKFILYFKENLIKHKISNKIYKNGYQIDHEHYCYDTDSINNTTSNICNISPNSFVLSIEDNIKLSRREIECMHLMSQGRTMEEIAQILNLSHRTIKAHIEHCKTKLNCKNLFQLGALFNKLNIQFIIQT